MHAPFAPNLNAPSFAPSANVDFDQDSGATTIFDNGDMDDFDESENAFEHMAAFLNLFNN